MKRKPNRKRKPLHTTTKVYFPAKTYRIIDEDGKVIDSFAISEDHPKITLHIDLAGCSPLETPMQRLENEVLARFEDAFDALKDLEKVNPKKALEIFEELFTEPEE